MSQNLFVYIRSVIGTRVETHFLKLSNLEGCIAEAIYKRLVEILEEQGLDRECLISLGTDGASTMVGKRSGVTTRFKNVNPFILSTHCASHRLALASSQAADKILYLVKYQEYINAVYKYYHYSPKNQRRLGETQKMLGQSTLRYKKVFGTRWLSFHDSVKAILSTCDSLLSALKSDVDDKSNGKAAGLLKSLGKFEFVAITHYVMDGLVILNRLSLSLQAANLTHADLILLLETTKQSLLNLKEKAGSHLEKFQESLTDSPDVLCEIGGSNATFLYIKGHELSINKKQVHAFRAVEGNFIDILVDNISERFSPDDSILSAFQVLTPACLPNSGLDNFGLEEIKKLGQYFGTSKHMMLEILLSLSFPKMICYLNGIHSK